MDAHRAVDNAMADVNGVIMLVGTEPIGRIGEKSLDVVNIVDEVGATMARGSLAGRHMSIEIKVLDGHAVIIMAHMSITLDIKVLIAAV